ncbi:hypothetical protein KO493_15635 [Tamlana agarivorans]|uniref:Uncharacterized protein n=1 Tax=Pseudotamlana agarivorans TaxID=481183 RepID=A0ACC5UCQ1_9FLAO|nr:hypothetical protein [Tamlana agarivorans]MBU2952132.1 hypothetical protein [Tamlana agarivorans]
MKFLYPQKDSNLDQRKTSSAFGNYPLSSYNTWHGGVHIETPLAALVAISDARIIAYKLPSEYLQSGHECPETYSNGFVLLQHEYRSPKGHELTFYSLYHHIASQFDIDINHQEIPDYLSEKVTKIKASHTPKGVRARSAFAEKGKKRGPEIVLIPKNHIVTRNNDELLADWAMAYNAKKTSEDKKYYSYTYTDPFTKTTYKDIHIHSNCLKLVPGESDKYKITYDKETNFTTSGSNNQGASLNKALKDGALCYNITASNIGKSESGTCIDVIPKGTEVTIIENSESEDKKWVRVKSTKREYRGYVQVRDLEALKIVNNELVDKIIACDIPIKAGQTVAYVGAFGFRKHEKKYASHVELFTDADDTDVSALLDNCAGDGEDNFLRYKLLSGITLEPYLKSKKELKAGTPVRVTQAKGDYVQVKVISLIRVIDKEKHLSAKHLGKNSKGKIVYIKDRICNHSRTRYEIDAGSFEYVNKQFNGLLTKGDFVYFYETDTGTLREIIIEPPFWNQEFWIDKSLLKLKAGETVTSGLETILDSDSCHIYIEEPLIPHESGNTFKKDIELKGKPETTITDDNGQQWYFVKESYEYEKEHYQHTGWIKTDDVDIEDINPFIWRNFGFETYDAGSEYVYAMKDYHKSPKTDVFIDDLWKMVDEDGNGVLTPMEFLCAQHDPHKSERMGKMVVKHKSEWSFTPEAIKPEAQEFYKLGIDLEKDPNKKKLLEQKRDAELEHLVEKIKNLMFWQELQNTTYTPKTTENDKEYEEKKAKIDTKPFVHPKDMPEGAEKEKKQADLDAQKDALDQEYKKGKYKAPETRLLPSSDMLWHFNVNSFVRQMRGMYLQNQGCETLIWGNKVSCEFRNKVIQVAKNLWGQKKKVEMANNLMAVFAWESGEKFKSDTPNMGNSGGTGLIQFMPSTAKALLGKEITIETVDNYWGKGKSLKRIKEFANMSEIEQLDYVEKYFKKLKNKDVEFVDFYLQVLYPASMGKPDNHIVFSKDGTGLIKTDKNYKSRIRAYKQNSGFDTNANYGNNDGQVSKEEIKKGVQKYLNKGMNFRNNCKNGCDYSNSTTVVENSDLEIQKGLNWASSISIKEEQLRKNAETKYIVGYKQESGKDANKRVDWSKEGIQNMDCSELVCRYLHKIGWSKEVKWLNTKGILSYAAKHPDKLEENTGDPKIGDIFVWNGHAGVVKKYFSSSKNVLTIEAISEKSYSWHEGIYFNGVVEWLYEKDKNHLKDNIVTGKIIHYFTPRKHYSK